MHSIRVDDDLWTAAMIKARDEGTSLTAVIAAALRAYAHGVSSPPEITPAETWQPPVMSVDPAVTGTGLRAAFPCCRHCVHAAAVTAHGRKCRQCP